MCVYVCVCVCVCTIKALKRVLLTSIEYKFSLYRLSFYFSVWWCAPGHDIAVRFVVTEEATSLLRSCYMQWKGLFYAPSFLTFRPLVFCGYRRTRKILYETGCSELIRQVSFLHFSVYRAVFDSPESRCFLSSVSSEPEFCFQVCFYVGAEFSISVCVCDALDFQAPTQISFASKKLSVSQFTSLKYLFTSAPRATVYVISVLGRRLNLKVQARDCLNLQIETVMLFRKVVNQLPFYSAYNCKRTYISGNNLFLYNVN